MTPWTIAHQASLTMGLSRKEYWGGLPLLSSEDFLNPGVKPESLVSPELAGRFFTAPLGKPATYLMWGILGSLLPPSVSSSAKHGLQDFPGGPVAKTPSSECRGPGLDPWSGN